MKKTILYISALFLLMISFINLSFAQKQECSPSGNCITIYEGEKEVQDAIEKFKEDFRKVKEKVEKVVEKIFEDKKTIENKGYENAVEKVKETDQEGTFIKDGGKGVKVKKEKDKISENIELETIKVDAGCSNGAVRDPNLAIGANLKVKTGNGDSNISINVGVNNNGANNSEEVIKKAVKKIEPIIEKNTKSLGTCSNYISDYYPIWFGKCSLNDDWDSNGKTTCIEYGNPQPEYSTCGENIETTTIIKIGNEIKSRSVKVNCNKDSCPSDATYPGQYEREHNLSIDLGNNNGSFYNDIELSDNNSPFANNKDTLGIKLKIDGFNGEIHYGNYGEIISITDEVPFYSDIINNNSGDKALSFKNPGKIIDNLIIPVRSVTPFKSNEGKIKILLSNGASIILKNIKYNFKKPFIGLLKAKNPISGLFDYKPTIGTTQEYGLFVEKSDTSFPNNIVKKLEDFTKQELSGAGIDKNFLKIDNAGMETSKSGNYYNFDFENKVLFSSRIEVTEDATKLPKPGIEVKKAAINYELSGKKVRYYLTGKNLGDDLTSMSSTDSNKFLGVKVIGTLQGAGNSEFTGQEKNFSNLHSLELKNQIKKNAYNYIKNMESGVYLNGVYYYKGDIKYSQIKRYISLKSNDTIIIENGNLIIDKNIINNKGIIVIKDGYDLENGYSKKGNIYITPNVSNINSMIYADGAIISVDNNFDLYSQDNLSRTMSLQNQLYVKGNIFTKNTIGGATKGLGKKFSLPGGTETNDFNLAMQYDLNYIRRGNNGCEKKIEDSNKCKIDNPMIIEYNSSIQSNPPKLFGSN